MTDEIDEILAGPPPKDKRTRCAVKDWLASLPEERREKFEAALTNSKWKTTALYELAKKTGFEKQYNSFRMHRAGSCSCD